MRWVQQVPVSHQLPSRMGKVFHPLIIYPMTIRMHIRLPSFPGFWIHLHMLVIPLCLFFSSYFPPRMCPLSCLPTQFWTVTCPHLSAGLVSDVVGLMSSSVPPYYSKCLFPSCYLFLIGLILAMKLEFPLVFWLIPWLFVEPSSPY